MVNENVEKLITAIMEEPDLQEQLKAAVDQPVTRGPAAAEEKGLGSAILQALAQSQGISFGSNDASQLTDLLSAASQQGYGQGGFFGGQTGGSSGGGLQLLGGGQPAQQPVQPVQQQVQPTGGTTIFGEAQSAQQAQGSPVDMETLNQFMQLFGGAQQLQQPAYTAPQQTQQQPAQNPLFQLFQGAEPAQSAQQAQPSGQFFSFGDSGSQGSSSPLSFGSSGTPGMSNMILQMLMQLMLGR